MQRRRDQVRAYRFARRRVDAALLGADADAPERPTRRVLAALLAGVLVAGLVAATVAAVALLAGAGLGGPGGQGGRLGGAGVGAERAGTAVPVEPPGSLAAVPAHRLVGALSTPVATARLSTASPHRPAAGRDAHQR